MAFKKLTLSHTAKDLYLECPYKYYLYYIEKLRTSNQSSALLFGNAIDKALNSLLTGEKDYLDIFNKEWDLTSGLNITYYKSDIDEKILEKYYSPEDLENISIDDRSWLSLKAKGNELLKNYYTQIYPKLKVKFSQKTVVVDIGDFEIKGIEDLIAEVEGYDNTEFILDNKTTSEKYSDKYINTRDQLPLYSEFENNRNVGYITLNKKTYKCDIILGKVEQSSVDRVITTFKEVYQKIKDNLFPKNTKACYSYGVQCPYYKLCHYNKIDKNLYKKEKEDDA